MKSVSNPRWKRAVLKISGAAFAGTGPQNVDPKVIMLIAREVAMASRVGVEVAIVIGGRNFFCSDTWVAATGTDRATAYQIGMMASAMNSLLLQASLEKIGIETRVQTAFIMQEIAEPYIRRRAIRHLEKGRVVIFGGIGAGMGNPLLTTDTAAALRASEINADVLLKGTNMDDGYECHSRTNSVVFEHISFKEVDSRGFSAMDMTAITFCAVKTFLLVSLIYLSLTTFYGHYVETKLVLLSTSQGGSVELVLILLLYLPKVQKKDAHHDKFVYMLDSFKSVLKVLVSTLADRIVMTGTIFMCPEFGSSKMLRLIRVLLSFQSLEDFLCVQCSASLKVVV